MDVSRAIGAHGLLTIDDPMIKLGPLEKVSLKWPDIVLVWS